MTTNQDEFIQSLEGELTPEQAYRLIELGEGDTDAKSSDEDGEPAAIAAKDEATQSGDAGETTDSDPATEEGKTKAPAEDELNADNAVVLAKDGKHTIGYDKLVEAREGEKHWKAQAEAAHRQLAELQAQAKERADAGEAATKVDNQAAVAQAAIDQGIDPGIFGDFSEEALAKGIATLVKSQVDAQTASLRQQLEPIQKQQATSALDAHYGAIYAKHPDADSIAESKELADWIATQPSFVRDGFNNVLAKGSTEQVIELFDTFKQATGATQASATAPKVDVKAQAKAAIDNAAPTVPNSLTDFPGGRAGTGSRDEAMADMDALQLLGSMDTMTKEQIDHYLSQL